MDCSRTVDFFKERDRMCKSHYACRGCPISQAENGSDVNCFDFIKYHTEKAIKVMQEWSDQNPPRTRTSVFLEAFPNAKIDNDGIPNVCAMDVFGSGLVKGCIGKCETCWNEPVEGGD